MTVTTVDMMRQAYHEAVNGGVIDYISRVRQDSEVKYSVSSTTLINMFDNLPLWKIVPQKGGHRKYKHLLTGVVIGFQNHGSTEINPGHAYKLMVILQEHVNLLGNEVFKFRGHNWKSPIDQLNYEQALENYNRWKRNIQTGRESA